jgi:hypothetical protein
VVPPQVTSVSGKPLSIAFEEIAASKTTYTRPAPEATADEAAEGEVPELVAVAVPVDEVPTDDEGPAAG